MGIRFLVIIKKLQREINRLLFKIPILKWSKEFSNNYRCSLVPKNLKRDCWAFKKGFYVETINLGGITKENHAHFLPDRTYNKLHPLNGNKTVIIDNKLYLPYLLSHYESICPEYYFFIEKGNSIWIGTDSQKKVTIYEKLILSGKLVMKPCFSELGNGFLLASAIDRGYVLLNDRRMSKSEFEQFTTTLTEYIVTEYIQQHSYAQYIYGNSANTIRLLYVWDPSRCEHIIAQAFHRFGMNGKNVDNLAKGNGLLAYMNVSTGEISDQGLIKYIGKPVEKTIISVHPNTGAKIAGTMVPNWKPTTSLVTKIMNEISFVKYTGIDVIMTDSGFRIIEMNSFPTLSAIQAEYGLLNNERTKSFFLKIIDNT